MNIKRQDFEMYKSVWNGISRTNGWHYEPFYVQVWVDGEGTIVDSVSTRGLDKDYILSVDTDEEINEYNFI